MMEREIKVIWWGRCVGFCGRECGVDVLRLVMIMSKDKRIENGEDGGKSLGADSAGVSDTM